MLIDPKMARKLSKCLQLLESMDQEIYIEENPGLWLEVRTTDDDEAQYRIDAETYAVSFRMGSESWTKVYW